MTHMHFCWPDRKRRSWHVSAWVGSLLLFGGFLALAVLPHGCTGTRDLKQTKAQRDESVLRLPVAGEWSEPQDGLRCRVRLASTDVEEMAYVGAGFEWENVSDAPLEFSGMLDSAGGFTLDGHRLGPVTGLHAQFIRERVRLAPGEGIVLGHTRVRVEPGEDASIKGQFGAYLNTGKATVVAKSIQLHVKPVEWGPPVNGLRMYIRPDRAEITAGEPLNLDVSVQNLGNDRLLMREWGTQTLQRSGSQIVARFAGGKNRVQVECGRGHISTRGAGAAITEPGTYRLRVALDASEPWQSPKGQAWSGELVSNETVVKVKAAEEQR